MHHKKSLFVVLIAVTLVSMSLAIGPDWGFYGHRLINRIAVYSLPTEIFGFYKSNQKFLIKHSVDPDMRRYSSPIEDVRHYIDLDHWIAYDSDLLRQPLPDVILTFSVIELIDAEGQSIWSYNGLTTPQSYNNWLIDNYQIIRDSVGRHINNIIEDPSLVLHINDHQLIIKDQFTDSGIVPYHLQYYQKLLTDAFRNEDVERILRLSAEIGHYISDAHVPLHVNSNYNGQKTGQKGIHAFWETRIPELFAEEYFDLFTNPAVYIDDKETYFWNIVLDSYELSDKVLDIEKELQSTFPKDQQFCFEQRGTQTIKTQCPEYAEHFDRQMNGMVERRMRSAISAISSSWYTAWKDAGMPKMTTDHQITDTEDIDNELGEHSQRLKHRQ